VSTNHTPGPVPPEILAEIGKAEAIRLIMPEDECFDVEFAAYFPDYCTSCVGYHGPLVVIVWGADPGAVSTFYRPWNDDHTARLPWQHCNSSAW